MGGEGGFNWKWYICNWKIVLLITQEGGEVVVETKEDEEAKK